MKYIKIGTLLLLLFSFSKMEAQNFEYGEVSKNELQEKFHPIDTNASAAIVYKRTLFIKKGMYSNNEYDEYRLFIEQLAGNDNAKIRLTKI